MNQLRIEYLHGQYISGRLTSSEQMEWKAALQNPENESQLRILMHQTWEDLRQEELADMHATEAVQIMTEILGQRQRAKTRPLVWRYAGIAACLLLIAITTIWFHKPAFEVQPLSKTTGYRDILPGSSGGTLTLSDGRQISINKIQSGKLAEEGNIYISKTADGEITYETKADDHQNPSRWNTLTTARGQTCKVHLPDGSEVWLNSASTIRYPSDFAGAATRQLELTGEAYFSISKNAAQPFLVNAAGQRIRVLGTQFNVNSYADEPCVHTTLVEGSVSINDQIKLFPGEQARSDSKGTKILQVNTEEFTDWKNGILSFDDEPISSVMRKVARWYNVEVHFQNTSNGGKKYSGTISRQENISSVLKVLEESEGILFNISGRVVTVIN